MKNYLKSALIGLLIPLQVLAGLPPTTLKSSDAANPTTTFNVQTPQNQATRISSTTGRIETGTVSFMKDPGAENPSGPVGWAGYSDAAGTSPVDGNGGSPTLTITRTTSTPLRESGSFLITHPASNTQGQGASYDFSIDPMYQAKVLQIKFDYSVASGTFVAGDSTDKTTTGDSDITIWIYDVTNGTIIQPTTYRLYGNSSASNTFISNFQTSASGTAYRIIFHNGKSNTSAFTLKFESDDGFITPSKYTYGTPITDWRSYTPSTTGFGTLASTTVFSRRVGDTLEVQGSIGTGTVTNVTAILGLGYAGVNGNVIVDTAKISAATVVGQGAASSGPSTTYFNTLVLTAGATSTVQFGKQTSLVAPLSAYATASEVAQTGQSFHFKFAVPIVGWTSSVQMSDSGSTQLIATRAHRNGTNQTGFNPNSTSVKVAFNSTVSPGGFDKSGAFDTANNRFVVATAWTYRISSTVNFAFNNVLANRYFISAYKNGSEICRGSDFIASAGNIFSLQVNCSIDLVATDYIEVFVFGAGNNSSSTLTIDGNPASTFLNVERIANPATMGLTESVSGTYNTLPSTTLGSGAALKYTTKVKDSHNLYNTSTGEVSINYSGTWRFAIGGSYSATANDVFLYVNGVSKGFFGTIGVGRFTSYIEYPVNAGDLVKIVLGGGTTAADTNGFFYFGRVGN